MKNLIVTFLLTFSIAAQAFDDGHLDAHVHGLIEMNLVAEANLVEVYITSPLMNLVGFEYAPRTKTEKAAINVMATHFETPQKWLQFDGSVCQLIHHRVSHGEDHDHDHARHESMHAELEANYQFKCDSDNLNSVAVSLQELFPAIESITLSWIVDTVSGLATLHHGDSVVYFRQ